MPRRVIEVVVRGRLDRSVAVALDGFTVETADTGLTRIAGSRAGYQPGGRDRQQADPAAVSRGPG